MSPKQETKITTSEKAVTLVKPVTHTHINIYTCTEERRLAGKQEFRGRRGGMRKVNRR